MPVTETNTMAMAREEAKYRCTGCGCVVGWYQMLIRNGVRNNCPACLLGGFVGTMNRID